MSLDTIKDLLLEQLQDIYYAEKHLVKALPKMARAASTPELATAFTNHLAETEEHVTRLEQVFEAMGEPAKAKKCPAIEGLIQESAEMMDEEGIPSVIDAGLIASARRVEHYEMAAYGSVRGFADALGMDEVVALLDSTLSEEEAAEDLLATISAETIVPAALAADGTEQETEDAEPETEGAKGPSKSRPARRAH